MSGFVCTQSCNWGQTRKDSRCARSLEYLPAEQPEEHCSEQFAKSLTGRCIPNRDRRRTCIDTMFREHPRRQSHMSQGAVPGKSVDNLHEQWFGQHQTMEPATQTR